MGSGSKQKLLHAARELFYRNGFIATSVDDIIAAARVSKSNFYYHFKSKEELGLAVLDQRRCELEGLLAGSLQNENLPPMERVKRFLTPLMDPEDGGDPAGCPFGNLIAEMAEHSETFRCRLSSMFNGLTSTICTVVEEGQRIGQFRTDLSADAIAALMVQTVQGAHLLAKCHKKREAYLRSVDALIRLIEPYPMSA
ncbi:MAG: TetR/AcrR family transcriptional regulator [Chthonomonadales bacterium]